tara:strand:+ start:502 stop:684 length:183 start_codon:yes stop_codon:yes gene_type:complete
MLYFPIKLLNPNYLIVAFGEIEISQGIVALLIGLSLFVFICVGISSLKLVQGAVGEEKEE